MKTLIVIPARRYAARLPNKPLRIIEGEPLIWHMVTQLLALRLGADIVVATDSIAVQDAISSLVPVYRAAGALRSGTERVAALTRLPQYADVEMVVNVQGDQLFVPAEAIIGAIKCVCAEADVGTAAVALATKDLVNPHRVKVLSDAKRVLNGARRVIGFARLLTLVPQEQQLGFCIGQHLGIYAARPETMRHWAALPPTALEEVMQLEQTLLLEAGMTMRVAWITAPPPLVIDTLEDLEHARERMEGSREHDD
jgi:3-deoxy-manno-octulosonate cytidylyltransferase (CMP-KDO synthetase)